jgi:hypothetical protein
MAFNQNSTNGKQDTQNDRLAGAFKADVDKAAEQGAQFADAARDNMNTMTDLGEKTADATKQVVQQSVEAASQQARAATDRFASALGFTGQDSERLAHQSKQNLEAVTRCGTVLTQAIQDASRSWFELSQKQWQRNLDGLNKLTRAKSVQEFTAIQSELAREGLQHMVQDSKVIAEASVRAVDEATKAFSSVAQQSPPLAR